MCAIKTCLPQQIADTRSFTCLESVYHTIYWSYLYRFMNWVKKHWKLFSFCYRSMLTCTCKYTNRRAGIVCWQSWPPIQVVRWNDRVDSVTLSSHPISLPSFNLPGRIAHWWQPLSAMARRTMPLPVTRQWHFLKQDKVITKLAPDNRFSIDFQLWVWFAS